MMNFPFYMFAPLDRQVDRGLATVADSFREAAQRLIEGGGGGEHEYLPINFLLRHAAELYLKSVILILHRSLRLPFEGEPWDGEPTIMHRSQRTKLRNLHSIKTLAHHAIYTFEVNLPAFAGKGSIDWTHPIPDDYQSWVDTIEAYDAGGTFFRYPLTKHAEHDHLKSQFKLGDLEAALRSNGEGGPPVMAFSFVDHDYVVTEAFIRDENVLIVVRDALVQIVGFLDSFTSALRADIAGGW